MDKIELLQNLRLSTLATVCIAALAACGGHSSSHNDEPDDPPVVGDVVLNTCNYYQKYSSNLQSL